MRYNLTQQFWRYQNNPCITNRKHSILYTTFYHRSLEIKLLASLLIALLTSYLRVTNLYRVLLLFIDFFQYIGKVQVLQLVLEVKHLLYQVLELSLVLYLASLIQLKLVDCSCKGKSLPLWQAQVDGLTIIKV